MTMHASLDRLVLALASCDYCHDAAPLDTLSRDHAITRDRAGVAVEHGAACVPCRVAHYRARADAAERDMREALAALHEATAATVAGYREIIATLTGDGRRDR